MIVIIDYQSGNIASLQNALIRLKVKATVTSDKATIRKASHVIFPGVGRAGPAMNALKNQGLLEVISNITAPFLGICLGMQLLSAFTEEDKTECLQLFSGKTQPFLSPLKCPHIGWNQINISPSSSPLFTKVPNYSYFYFVNSFYLPVMKEITIASSEYGVTFSAAVQKNNFYGVQFHPEKSGEQGLTILKNFLNQ